VYGNNTDNTYTSKTGNYPAIGLKQFGNEYDDSGLPVITAQINPAMLNPGGRSIKFDEFNPGAVFTPSSYYTYTPLPASVVRVVVPIYAGADKVVFPVANNALPVKLLSFNVSLSTGSDKKAKATWITADEETVAAFDVHRSGNGKDFVSVGQVTPNNRAGVNAYEFLDVQPLKGVSYYRLKQMDKDGHFKFSSIVRVVNNDGNSLSVYPNPSSDIITIAHPQAGTTAVISLLSVDGRVIQRINVTGSVTSVPVSHLAAGSYFIQYESKDEKIFQKFEKY
jgi:hypothetical protein